MGDEKMTSHAMDEHAHRKAVTQIMHAGNSSSHWTYSPVMPPLYMSTTFETLEPGVAMYEYSRCDNPTRTELQRYLAALESAKHALAFSSGLGALTTVSYLLKSGQHVLCCDDVYGGTNRFFSHCSTRMGIETTFIDGVSLSNWLNAFRKGQTKLVWIETPTNPTMKIVDISNIVNHIKELDAECIVVVDNTFMSPLFQSPLKMGADIVMHSCTKYINGHSDVIMGAIMTNNEDLYKRLKFMQNALGIVPSAFDCSQVIRSIKTLDVRVRRQQSSAMLIADYLESDKCSAYVERVLYPGLKSHPQHELAEKQCSGFSGMISIYLKPSSIENGLSSDKNNNKDRDASARAVKLVQSVKVFHTAVSLGCVCSLIEIPSLMTHSAIPEKVRSGLGVTDNLVRLSIGLEDPQDLIEDLKIAFQRAYES